MPVLRAISSTLYFHERDNTVCLIRFARVKNVAGIFIRSESKEPVDLIFYIIFVTFELITVPCFDHV